MMFLTQNKSNLEKRPALNSSENLEKIFIKSYLYLKKILIYILRS